MAQFKGISGGKLNVAVISAGDYFFPRLLVEFAKQHTGVSLNFDVCNREELLSQLNDNLTDLAIMVRPPLGLGTVNEPLAPHPYVVVAAPEHPLAGQKNISLSRLAKEPFLVREKGSDTRQSMEEGFGAHMAGLNIAMEIKSTETIKQAVISRELDAGSLSVLDVAGFPLMLHWYVVHRQNKRLTPVAQAFKDYLMCDGSALIEQTIGGRPKRLSRLKR
jgi:DNA-binding transcriptional LysR family regulator